MKITFGDVNTRVQYGFPAVALLSTTGKCLVSPTLHHGSISLLFTSHFNAFFFALKLLSETLVEFVFMLRTGLFT